MTKIVTFEYDTRASHADALGLERPVAVTFHGEVTVVFRNDLDLATLPWQRQHVAPGGLTDGFMRWILGDEPIFSSERRRRYMADRYHIYGTTRFEGFCLIFLLGWLRRHRARYEFEILARQAHIARLDVWPKSTLREEGHWSFFPGPAPANEDGHPAYEYDADEHARIETARHKLNSLSVRAHEVQNALVPLTQVSKKDALETLDTQAVQIWSALSVRERLLLQHRFDLERPRPTSK